MSMTHISHTFFILKPVVIILVPIIISVASSFSSADFFEETFFRLSVSNLYIDASGKSLFIDHSICSVPTQTFFKSIQPQWGQVLGSEHS